MCSRPALNWSGSAPVEVEDNREEHRLRAELPVHPPMLVYRGADVPHWREAFDGKWCVQTFLHYVDADGQYTDFKFDGRERIGPFDKATMQRRFLREASYARDDRMVAPPPDSPCPCGSGKLFKECHALKA